MTETEQKARFFALHYGHSVIAKVPFQKGKFEFTKDSPVLILGWASLHEIFNTNSENWALLLTPLSAITDEHLLGLINSVYPKHKIRDVFMIGDEINFQILSTPSNDWLERKLILAGNNLIAIVCDYLRSKGYALPFMGISVETMIEKGWIKLKEETV